MTTEREFDALIAAWMDSVRSPEPEHLLEDVLAATRSTEPRGAWQVRLLPNRGWDAALWANRMASVALGATALVLAVVVGIGLLANPPNVGPPPPGTAETATPEASLAALDLPGARPAPAGQYGWTGSRGASAGMHRVTAASDSPGEFRQTQLMFAVADDCFAYGIDAVPQPVSVSGLEGTYVEPYEDPAVMFIPAPRGSATTGAYALAVADRTLCVYLTWDPDTAPGELEAARQVVESLRAQPFGRDGVRINFTLPEGWDTG